MDEQRCGNCGWRRGDLTCKETRKERAKRQTGEYDWCSAWKKRK